MIEVTDLVKNYGSVPAVRGVSLGVARGEVVVLIGPSGCGKSTLLRCVHLIEEPTSGTIRVGEQEISFGGGGWALAGRTPAAFRPRLRWPAALPPRAAPPGRSRAPRPSSPAGRRSASQSLGRSPCRPR